MTPENLVTGLRIGGIALFAWLWWRIMFESWEITTQPPEVRIRGWVYFRLSIIVMCFIMVFLASPANLLLANNYISLDTNFWMMSGVTVFACLYATLMHHALDITNGARPVTWIACVLIFNLSAVFGMFGG